VEIPVRTLEIHDRSGQPTRALRVFCPRSHASIETRACASCEFAEAFDETAVVCRRGDRGNPEPPARGQSLFIGPNALALRTPLGSVCAVHSVAVRVDVPVAHARKLLDRDAVVIVLDADERVTGVMLASDPIHRLAALDDVENRTPALPESAPLVEAFELMVHSRARFVPVTGDEGRFVGVVADLDVLRWVARSRTPRR
jgi:CBS domain